MIGFNTVKTTILLTVLTLLVVYAGRAMGGQAGMVMAFGMAVVMNVGAYWFSDKIVLAMYRAQSATEAEAPRLHEMVQSICEAAKIPMPKLFIIPQAAPNAFATGRNPSHAAVAVTKGILELLSYEELRAVLGHEIAHVINRDTLISTVAATLAGAISTLAHMARWAMIFGGGHRDRDERDGGHPAAGLVMIIVAPIAAALIQFAISRAREYQADATGAKLSDDPLSLASALRKMDAYSKRIPMDANPSTAHLFIVNPLTADGFIHLFSTHPPIPKRIERLEKIAMASLKK